MINEEASLGNNANQLYIFNETSLPHITMNINICFLSYLKKFTTIHNLAVSLLFQYFLIWIGSRTGLNHSRVPLNYFFITMGENQDKKVLFIMLTVFKSAHFFVLSLPKWLSLPDENHELNPRVVIFILNANADNTTMLHDGPHYGGLLRWFCLIAPPDIGHPIEKYILLQSNKGRLMKLVGRIKFVVLDYRK